MSQDSSSTPNSSQTSSSFVWTYFVKVDKGQKVQCQYVSPNGQTCDKRLARDKSSSTKSMIGHLKTQHGLSDPSLKGRNANIGTFFKKANIETTVCTQIKLHGSQLINLRKLTSTMSFFYHDKKLTVETLKTSLCYLLADADLPLSLVERPSFHNLLRLCNPNSDGMQVKRHATAAHMYKIFEHTQEYIAEVELRKADYVSITTDAWTSPNNKAYMAMTVHLITKDFQLKEYTIRLPEVKGKSQSLSIF